MEARRRTIIFLRTIAVINLVGFALIAFLKTDLGKLLFCL